MTIRGFHFRSIARSGVFSLGISVLLAAPLSAQRPAEPLEWRLWMDGRQIAWPSGPTLAPDSLDTAIASALEHLQRLGHIEARFDSVSTNPDGVLLLQYTGGPRYIVESVDITASRPSGDVNFGRLLRTRSGDPFDPVQFERDIDNVLHALEARGFVTAEVRIVRFETWLEDGQGRIRIGLEVDHGVRPTLTEIRLPGAERTRGRYISRLTGLVTGETLWRYDADEIRGTMVDTGDFARVGSPLLLVEPDGRAVIVLPLEEAAPGSFDAVVGYLPATSAGTRGSLVGNVDISLRHIMGQGRRFKFQFNRMPARVSRLLVEGEDPFLAGFPVRLAGGFDGYQKDSTYSRQRFRVESGYRIGRKMEAFLSLSREATRPGTDSLVSIPRSNSWFVGVGFRIGRLDHPTNPSRGWRLSLSAERGSKVRSLSDAPATFPTPSVVESVGQQRLLASWRLFVPVVGRHFVVWGGETSVVLSPVYDAADLYQLGGANSLRGYNEEQFEGNFVGRTLAEWRFRLDENSFMFIFADLGILGTPAGGTGGQDAAPGPAATSRLYPGYGLGMQFGTEAGQFAVSLALNPSEGLGTKVHVGISLGL